MARRRTTSALRSLAAGAGSLGLATSAVSIATIIVIGLVLIAACTDEPRIRGAREAAAKGAKADRRDVEPFFQEVSDAIGARTPPSRTWGSAFVDFDRDGWPDLLVGRHLRKALLLRNRSGLSFSLLDEPSLTVVEEGRTYYDRHGCAWGEANGDGSPDAYCAAGAQSGEGEGRNQLLLQTRSGLRDAAAEMDVQDALGRGRSVHWLDFDGDGDLDLFVGNEIRSGRPNVLFENLGGEGFVRADAGLSVETPTRSSSWTDWDNDGDPDLVVLGHGFVGSRAYRNIGGHYEEVVVPSLTGQSWLSASWGDFDVDGWADVALVSETRLLIMRNERGSFREIRSLSLDAGRMAAWLDVDNDGDLDAFVLQGQPGDPPASGAVNAPDFFLLNREGAFRVNLSDSVRGPRRGNDESVAVSDYDRDGRLDLHVTEGYLNVLGGQRLLTNRTSIGNWIGVELDGPNQNPFGIGSRIVADTGKSRLHYFMNDGVAFASQSEIGYAHVGLGSANEAVIRVTWPDGTSSCIRSEASEIVRLSYGSAGCPE